MAWYFLVLFLALFSSRLSEKPISLEEVEIFLKLAALGLIENKLLFRNGSISLLEIDWVDMVDSDDCKQEDTNIFGINLIFLQSLICFMDKCPL